ncbi:MAG: hypothetical protein VKP62_05235, partial [Candidatus Sericytochromatia bacterium]|nr:hypothetical protein [Candidatus Sericytochromatia bacterium]
MSLIRRSALAAVWVAALAGGGCFAAPPRSAGLAVPTATGPIRPPQKAQLAPIEALLSPDGQPVVNPASLRDPVPKVARPADAPPEAGMPEVKQLPNGGEAPRSGDEPASLESQAGELPVYAVEAPAEPPASAF